VHARWRARWIELRAHLPQHHLEDESRHTVQLGIGLVATMTALILGLITASTKSSFDALHTTIKHTAAHLLALDRALARYGPETAEVRGALKAAVADRIDLTWSRGTAARALDPADAARGVEQLAARIRDLAPQTDDQRWLQSRALELSESLLEARWLLLSGLTTSVPVPFLAILVFWLTITFASFGLFAPRNATVVAVLVVCALSVAGAVFLVLEMDGPFEGLITVSADPMEYAVGRLGE
jgi:hypothetical protein